MPALLQASYCAECYKNMQPFTWIWSNCKCFNLQSAQRPGASPKQLRFCEGTGVCCGLNCHMCCYFEFVGFYLTCHRAASESCFHISRQLNCCSDHLSVLKRPQYNCKELLLWTRSVHFQQMVSSRSLQRPMVAKREGVTFQIPVCWSH